MPTEDDLIEKLVLGEIEGKNCAIHAYDSIVWKIRTGFLTLLVAGDSAEVPYDTAGYRDAWKAEFTVYLIPLVIVVAVLMII